VKYGTQVFGRGGNNHFKVPVMKREHGELVPMTTWQVERSTFDALLLATALERGAMLVKGSVAAVKQSDDGRITGCTIVDSAGDFDEDCDYFVDATGQCALLSTKVIVDPKEHGRYAKQIAIYAHMEGTHTLDTRDTTIFYREKYHWCWYIPITEHKISVGIVVPSDYFKQSSLSREEFFEQEIHCLNPRLAEAVELLSRCSEVRASSNYSYTVEKYTGPNYLCVGDAHKFIDPIFSYGVHFALHEAAAAAEAIAGSVDGVLDIERYENYVNLGQRQVQSYIDSFWDNPVVFGLMVHDPMYRNKFIDLFSGRIYEKRDILDLLHEHCGGQPWK